MEPLSIATSVIALLEATSQCLKLAKIGPSKHSSDKLEAFNRTLYGLNGTLRNLQLHLEIYEEDQSRLDAMKYLNLPLSQCSEALDIIRSRMEKNGIWKHVTGMKFDKRLEDCLQVLQYAQLPLDLALQYDQR